MSLTIGIRYLRGYAVATDSGNREEAEWPPHPARVFMAMAAAHFETGEHPAERAAIVWLEALPAPAMQVPEALARSAPTVYVPVNDKAGPSKSLLQSAPGLPRSRQPRHFPTVRVGDEPVYCIWPEATPDDDCREALAALCGKVTRLGHSSSLVQMWLAEESPEPNLVPVDTAAQNHLRCVSIGTLDYLRQQYNGPAVEQFAELTERIGATKGKEQAAAKAEYERVFGEKWKASASPPPSRRPTIGLTQGYRRVDGAPPSIDTGVLDDRLLILAKGDGPALGLESTLALTTALRGAVMAHGPQPPPEWVSGHTADSGHSESPHLALVPMAYVGADHADGHVLGMALVFPRDVSLAERGRALSALLTDSNGLPRELKLTLGKLGEWALAQEERSRPPSALQAETWTAAAQVWASVTPIVLDRFPKADYRQDRTAWRAEVADILTRSCLNIGLPAPAEIDVDKTSWHLGAPRARPGHGGFPLLPARPGKPARYQVHAWLRFAQPVAGPLLLGAGRYLGYGLCKPLPRHQGDLAR